MRLEGKVVVITGAGSGLGRESARLFAREGAKVVIMDIIAERAEGTEKLVADQGGVAVSVHADVTKEADVARTVETALEEYGKLDVMFANAGIRSRGGVPTVIEGTERIEFQDYPEEAWHEVLAVNLTGVFLSCKHAVAPMRANGGGAIVVTSSAASFAAYPALPSYAATKAGVNGLVRGLSFELGKYGIRVNAICPTHGMSPNFLMPRDAEVVGRSYEEFFGSWDKRVTPIPLKLDRPPSLLDNAKVALFLASDDSAYMSGVCLPATDGGTLSRVAIPFQEDIPVLD